MIISELIIVLYIKVKYEQFTDQTFEASRILVE